MRFSFVKKMMRFFWIEIITVHSTVINFLTKFFKPNLTNIINHEQKFT